MNAIYIYIYIWGARVYIWGAHVYILASIAFISWRANIYRRDARPNIYRRGAPKYI